MLCIYTYRLVCYAKCYFYCLEILVVHSIFSWLSQMQVLVMTPAILLSALRHSLLTLNMIKVLIFDECHHARGNHAYACILKPFYMAGVLSQGVKVCNFIRSSNIWDDRIPCENKGYKILTHFSFYPDWVLFCHVWFYSFFLLSPQVYTCESESVLARFVPFSTPSFKLYQHMEMPSSTRAGIVAELEKLAKEHLLALATLDLKSSTVNSIKKRLSKICSSITYCLDELGILMALKAAQSFSVSQNDFVLWGQQEKFSETSIKKFCSNASQAILAYIPDGPYWSVANIERNLEAGLITSKILCLVESLLGYRSLEKIRCIIFVERVIAAMVLESFLNEILPTYNSWKTKYVAGNNSGLQSQTRKKQNKTVEDFRKGLVNIIVSTSILEEGLDVQSCNLVVGFDPASNICSFIQSQGRARMPNSDYLMMVESGDMGTQSRLKKYISGAKRMREDSLSHSLVPYQPLPDDSSGEVYRVDSTGAIVQMIHPGSTGAIVTLSSSVSLIYFYCSRLPSDKYFKPTPRFDIDKDQGNCTLYLPKSCQVKEVKFQGNGNVLKQAVCLKACIQLHQAGALTDHLVPDMGKSTPETVKLHPVRELTELCQKAQFELSKAKGFENGEAYFTVEVEAKEMSFAHTAKASDKKMAKKLAYKEVLNSLKKS
ncbi:hypothetical protein DY000_02051582 [Brassica cretica]|uniref:Dicer-like 104 n=1 Tax=Brassica cretica TaxID=69181 RepID=A0ABQ7F4D3_BRACR|nr:hypothetical protein DY000_02051582 [Brassica cretica]